MVNVDGSCNPIRSKSRTGEISMTDSILNDDLLMQCAKRAPVYDRENRFFQEGFAELRQAGYLLMAVPREFGGHGLSLARCAQETRRLASHAPATALALNMHTYWVGTVADVWRSGDHSLQWVLEEAASGEV